jgi:basic membrane protein A
MHRRARFRFVAACAVLGMLVAACADDDDTTGATSGTAVTAATVGGFDTTQKLKVAILWPGRDDDHSFSQAGAEGIRAAAAADGNVEVTEVQEMADPSVSEPAIQKFCDDRYDLIIGHGIEYADPIGKVAAACPTSAFQMSGGVASAKSPSVNVNDWFYNLQDIAYPLGLVAGNATTPGTRIGIVGGSDLNFVKSMHASFRQAVVTLNPTATFDEVFAASFTDVQKGAEAAQTVIDRGATFLYCSGNGICTGVAQTAQAKGIPFVSGNGSGFQTAPDEALASTGMHLESLYTDSFKLVRAKRWGNTVFASSIENGQVELSFNEAVKAALFAKPVADIKTAGEEFVSQVKTGAVKIPVPPS